MGVKQRRIALNKPLSFQPTHTLKARRWGKSHTFRKLDVRNTPILLQLIKNVTIDTVEIFARALLAIYHYLDASLLVFVEITLNRGAPDVFEQFNTAVQKLEEIQECHLVSGDFDYLLKTRVPDMSAYRKLLGETLLRLPGVNDTRTYVVMEEVKQSNRLVIKTR